MASDLSLACGVSSLDVLGASGGHRCVALLLTVLGELPEQASHLAGGVGAGELQRTAAELRGHFLPNVVLPLARAILARPMTASIEEDLAVAALECLQRWSSCDVGAGAEHQLTSPSWCPLVALAAEGESILLLVLRHISRPQSHRLFEAATGLLEAVLDDPSPQGQALWHAPIDVQRERRLHCVTLATAVAPALTELAPHVLAAAAAASAAAAAAGDPPGALDVEQAARAVAALVCACIEKHSVALLLPTNPGSSGSGGGGGSGGGCWYAAARGPAMGEAAGAALLAHGLLPCSEHGWDIEFVAGPALEAWQHAAHHAPHALLLLLPPPPPPPPRPLGQEQGCRAEAAAPLVGRLLAAVLSRAALPRDLDEAGWLALRHLGATCEDDRAEELIRFRADGVRL